MMADFALFAACNCDKFIYYRCAAGHSYTNTAEQGQAILNLGCANHTTVLDPNAPDFLINDVLYNASTMKEGRESVGQYVAELQKAIEWIERVHGNDSATIENNVSPPTGVAESNAGSNSPGDPEPTVDVGEDVKKFFSNMGWYDGTVSAVHRVRDEFMYNIRFSDGDNETWTQEELDKQRKVGSVRGTKPI